ncbi:MAG: tetratricopeptide repeat protein [Leptolyngbya sp. SIOISBB]|nr:tetratricopeptide repeat protein [Leptolyngbya sp. SIOISBB]
MRVSTAPVPALLTVQSTHLTTDYPSDVLPAVLAIAHKNLSAGHQRYQHGQLSQAQQKFTTALSYYTQAQATVGIGKSLSGLSAVHLQLGTVEQALADSQAAVAVLEETSATIDYAIALYQLGLSHGAMHHQPQAERYLTQALALFEALENREYENEVLLHLGQLYLQQSQFTFALACYRAVLDSLMQEPIQENSQRQLKQVLSLMMQLCAQTKTGPIAVASFQTLLEQHIPADASQQIARLIQQLGQFHESQEQYRLALECYAQALQTIPPVAIA